MRIFFWIVISSAVFVLVNRVAAQDSLNYNPLTLTQSTIIDAFTPVKWRMSGSAGYHRLLPKGYANDNLYLTHGFQASLSTDYFVGRYWGLGISMGYQNLAVSDLYKKDPGIPKFPTPRFVPVRSLNSFMLTIGPAFSLPLSQRVLLDIDLRGGLFYNEAPVLGAYLSSSFQDDPANGVFLTTVIPSDRRFRAGFNASAGIKYQLTQQMSAGLSATTSFSSFGYTLVGSTNNFNQKQVEMTTYGVQVGVSYRFLASQRTRVTPVTPATSPRPVCYPPILDPAQINEYYVGTTSQPVIRWRSSAPIYTEGERYSFRLYTLPGNKLVYEKTVQEPQLTWPAQLAIPDTSSYFFYSISTTRVDNFEQTCRSEPVVGTLGFYKRPSAEKTQPTAPREPAFTLKLYELRLVPLAKGATPQAKGTPKQSKLTKGRKPVQTKPVGQLAEPVDSIQTPVIRPDSVRADSIRLRPVQVDSVRSDSIRTDSTRSRSVRSDSVRTDSVRLDSIRADSVRARTIQTTPVPAATKVVFRLVYDGPIQEPDFTWPSLAPLPTQPTVYQYIISRVSNRQIVKNHYLLVEPDGCSTIIYEAAKNKRLQYNSPPRQPILKKSPN
ncbi:outer membrane beta-barrel protein [Spirosoma radiotolerans]|uniref:Outer membrane protein beta-barrel domain-containing protein n=1 Tax=Spirosoma radiotolerans TaxID=1379870 RepID=A0A0E3V878_9BACT|nr:outer membrane beta-barrel protein [Spirosoma radiotolerans]AKD56066.1 hypothetical protein SD10_15350 [Spirosoma radiotolerans]